MHTDKQNKEKETDIPSLLFFISINNASTIDTNEDIYKNI
jgi:hypothetical protein